MIAVFLPSLVSYVCSVDGTGILQAWFPFGFGERLEFKGKACLWPTEEHVRVILLESELGLI